MSKTEFDLGPELQGYVDRVIKEVLPETKKALEEEVAELRRHAESNWPVMEPKDRETVARVKRAQKAGKIRGEVNAVSRDSRGKWRHGVRMTPDGLEAFVENTAPYSAFIAEKGTKGKKRVFQRLLFRRFGAKRQNALWAKVAKELG